MGTLVGDYSQYKRFWRDHEPSFLQVAAVAAILRTIFGVMAYESDVDFWDGKQNFRGISVKTLYANIIALAVISLHLLQNGAPLLIIGLHLIGVAIEVWKLSQATHFEGTSTFPYLKLSENRAYVESGTKSFDARALTLLSYALCALMMV